MRVAPNMPSLIVLAKKGAADSIQTQTHTDSTGVQPFSKGLFFMPMRLSSSSQSLYKITHEVISAEHAAEFDIEVLLLQESGWKL